MATDSIELNSSIKIKHYIEELKAARLYPDLTVVKNRFGINSVVVQLAYYFESIGQENVFSGMIAILKDANLNNEKVILEKFYDKVCENFKKLSTLPKECTLYDKQLKKHTEALKKLKKLIHQFARENNLSPRLINLEKVHKRLEQERSQKEIDNNRFVEKEKNSAYLVVIGCSNSFIEEKVQISKAKLENIDSQLSFIKGLLEKYKRYIDIGRYEVDEYRTLENISDNIRFTSQAERQSRRQMKSRLNKISWGISLIVALGEGIVVAVFMTAFLPFPVAFLVVGTLGFLCNLYLFRRSSTEVLRDLFFGRMFKKLDGIPLLQRERNFVIFSLIFSAAAAICIGCLSFSSAVAALTQLFGLAAAVTVATTPVGIIIVATIIALVTTFALFTLFTHMTANWFREEGPRKLKKTLCDVPHQFVEFWKHKNWARLSKKAKLFHIFKKLAIAFLKILHISVIIALVAVVIVASAGLLKHKAVDMFHVFFQIGEKIANALAYTFVILGGLINSLFTATTTVVGLSLIQNFIQSIINILLNPRNNYHEAKNFVNTKKSNPIQFYETVFLSIEHGVLGVCALVNCFAQGIGSACDKTAQAWTRLPNLSCIDPSCVGISGFLSSFGANVEAISDTIEEKKEKPYIDQSVRFFWKERGGINTSESLSSNSSQVVAKVTSSVALQTAES